MAIMRNSEYSLTSKGRGTASRDAMGYAEQLDFEKYLEGFGLSDLTIAEILANQSILNAATSMTRSNPKMSLEEAVIKCSGIKRDDSNKGSRYAGTCVNHGAYEGASETGEYSPPPGINVMGQFVPIKGRGRTIPFSSLKGVDRNKVLGDHRDSPYVNSHQDEHWISYEKE